MPTNEAALYHNNGYNAQGACEHCEGIIRHERWCQTLNPVVCYACKIVVSPDELTIGDAIILPSLGVPWDHPTPLAQLNRTVQRERSFDPSHRGGSAREVGKFRVSAFCGLA